MDVRREQKLQHAHSENSGLLIKACDTPRRPIHKTKSLDHHHHHDHHMVVNIAEDDDFVSGFEEEGYSRRVYPSSMTRDTLPPDLSDDLITPPNHEDSSSDRLQNDDDYESSCWRKMKIHMEPTLPIHLKFEDVRYKVVMKGGKRSSSDGDKLLLDGITGWVRPGEVLALMGPSGGGKTTLLNLLSGRVKINSGSITYNDVPYTKSIKRRIGYVTQDDVVFPHLTVKETLTYAALLRMSRKLTKQQKEERAMDVINELGLARCQDTIIGSAIVKGISGGERKRMCIGNEILLNPSLLFLDEPTSGLDSTTSLRIVQMLHNLARGGKTVVTTIHQPSSRLFSKFDKLILLGNGSSLYFGKASEAMLYFSSIGCSPLIAMNPAEFLIDLANGNINDKSFPSNVEHDECSRRFQLDDRQISPLDVHEYLVGAYRRSAKTVEKKKLREPASAQEMQRREWGVTWCQQFSILLKRGLKERRHEYFSCLRVTQIIVTAIVVGLLWWHSGSSSPKQLKDQAGLLFFVSIFWGYIPLFTALFKFPQERAMLAKERSVGMYKLSAYFVATNISDLLLDLPLPVVFLTIVYFMVGLRRGFAPFSLTMIVIFSSIMASQGLGYSIGAAFLDVKKATTFASIVVMAFMLSAGFFIEDVPSFMSWIRHVSFNSHTYRLLVQIQYSDCPGSIYCDVHDGSGTIEAGAMLAMIAGYRIIAYLFLKKMKLRNNA